MANDNVPIPDPTVLTTQQLLRELSSQREYLESQITGLKELHEEKFRAVDIQFEQRDRLAEMSARDSKTAVDAAFQSSKEAVAKSETSTNKSLDSLNEKIDDVKNRVTSGEGKGEGMSRFWGYLVGGVGIALAIMSHWPKS